LILQVLFLRGFHTAYKSSRVVRLGLISRTFYPGTPEGQLFFYWVKLFSALSFRCSFLSSGVADALKYLRKQEKPAQKKDDVKEPDDPFWGCPVSDPKDSMGPCSASEIVGRNYAGFRT
jgi:hypothetical protein